MTKSQAISWLNAQKGKHLDYDQQYGQQCFDFFNYYYQAITGDNPFADGYGVSGAKDIWSVPNPRLTKISDSTVYKPQSGDILIYGSTWGAGYGHVEVVLASDNNGVTVIGENEHGNTSEGVVTVYRTWAQTKGLLGGLTPHFDPETNQGGSMSTVPDTDAWFWRMNKLMQQIRGRAIDRAEFRKNFVGVDQFHMVEIISDDPEADAATNAQTVGQTALRDNWEKQIVDLTAQTKVSVPDPKAQALKTALTDFLKG